MTDIKRSFGGFSSETLSFFNNLKANNSKEWFAAHKPEYQKYLLGPLHGLSSDLSEGILAIDPMLIVGTKSVSRIQRDTRFSKNKSPYKSTMWITFKRSSVDWADSPAYFFEISSSSYRYGMGYYSASPDTMRKFRQSIDDKPTEFRKAISFYPKQKTFVIEGERYKKIFDETKPDEIQDWYQRKNLYLVCNRQIDDRLFGSKLVDDMLEGFNLIAPFYHYLLKANELSSRST